VALDHLDKEIGRLNRILEGEAVAVRSQQQFSSRKGGALVALGERVVSGQGDHQGRPQARHILFVFIEEAVDRYGASALEQTDVPDLMRFAALANNRDVQSDNVGGVDPDGLIRQGEP
jgi:hypothetical protein